MLRNLLFTLAAATALVGVVSCATSESEEIEAGARAACINKDSPPDAPTYDEACMRDVREQIIAARNYRPSTKPPQKKKK